MATKGEQRVFLFLLLVGAAGLIARTVGTHQFERQAAQAVRTSRPGYVEPTRSRPPWGARALDAQQRAVDSALQSRAVRAARPRVTRPRRDTSGFIRSPSIPEGRIASRRGEFSTDYASSVMPSVHEPVDINRATAEQLEQLPRVGPALAQRIVARRISHGPYRSLDDLRHIRGIGPATLRLVAPLVTFSGRHSPLHSVGRF